MVKHAKNVKYGKPGKISVMCGKRRNMASVSYSANTSSTVDIVQSANTSVCGTEDRGFDSRYPPLYGNIKTRGHDYVFSCFFVIN